MDKCIGRPQQEKDTADQGQVGLGRIEKITWRGRCEEHHGCTRKLIEQDLSYTFPCHCHLPIQPPIEKDSLLTEPANEDIGVMDEVGSLGNSADQRPAGECEKMLPMSCKIVLLPENQE